MHTSTPMAVDAPRQAAAAQAANAPSYGIVGIDAALFATLLARYDMCQCKRCQRWAMPSVLHRLRRQCRIPRRRAAIPDRGWHSLGGRTGEPLHSLVYACASPIPAHCFAVVYCCGPQASILRAATPVSMHRRSHRITESRLLRAATPAHQAHILTVRYGCSGSARGSALCLGLRTQALLPHSAAEQAGCEGFRATHDKAVDHTVTHCSAGGTDCFAKECSTALAARGQSIDGRAGGWSAQASLTVCEP